MRSPCVLSLSPPTLSWQARAKELKQKENKAREAAASEAVEKTPWEETVKTIEESFWAQIGVKDGEGGDAQPIS